MRRNLLFVVALVLPFVGSVADAGGWRGGHGALGHGMRRPASNFVHGTIGHRYWRRGHGRLHPFYGYYYPFFDAYDPGYGYSYPPTPSIQVNIEIISSPLVAPRERSRDEVTGPHWVRAPAAPHRKPLDQAPVPPTPGAHGQ
jgi:hypothetical protein